MQRIKPGDECIIVAEWPGCECNIGATLTADRYFSGGAFEDPDNPPAWSFYNASRPLKVTGQRVGDAPTWVTQSVRNEEGYICCIPDKFLVPIPKVRPVHTETDSQPLKETA